VLAGLAPVCNRVHHPPQELRLTSGEQWWLVLDLARCDYIERRENVLALGNSGTGKTHIALALGLAACQKGYRVRFATAAALVHELIEARDEKRLLRLQKQLAAAQLLLVDELGFVPLSKTGAELLFEIFRHRYSY
jgi:DNA replication protein DnaC